jgi:SAM-dependent methyltransferase
MKKISEYFGGYNFTELLLIFIERKLKIRLPISHKIRWKFNISYEIRFWDKCIKTNGLIWPDEYKLRFNPLLPLQQEVAILLPKINEVRILDVGAGPFTYLGKVHQGIDLNITAIDPLADEYDRILKKYSKTPLIRTQKLNAENLSKKFQENSFDLVFARNCIDHAYSPETAILEMIKVVKKGRYVLLIHRPNEAENENWEGLHQWNFSEYKGDFLISSKNLELNFTKKYIELCEIQCTFDANDNMLHTKILKK